MRNFDDASYDYGLAPGEAFDPDELADEPFDPSRPHVMTALGPIDPGALGVALPHATVLRRPVTSAPADADRVLDDPALALLELESLFYTGGRTVVDLTTADAGRDVAGLAWVAARAPVHLVLATGAPRSDDRRTETAIADEMVRELTVGLDETSIKAGVIVLGGDEQPVGAMAPHLLEAAAIAHLATGAPIVLLAGGESALPELAILGTKGVSPNRVIVGHLDAGGNEADLHTLLARGATALFDRWSMRNGVTDAERAALVKRLVDSGFGGQLLLSCDLSRRSERLAYGGEPGFPYFLDRVPLALMEAGLTAPQVRLLFVDNSARALTIQQI